jgi:hypothetical protein
VVDHWLHGGIRRAVRVDAAGPARHRHSRHHPSAEDQDGLAHKVDELERKYDKQFKVVFDAVRRLMAPPEPPRKRIGFSHE